MFDFIACLHATERTLSSKCIRSRNGDGEIRTLDPLLARQVLSQLSYTPTDSSWDAGPPVSRATSILLIGFFNPMGLSEPFLPCECYRGKGTPKWA